MNICILNHRENNPYIGGVERISFLLGHEWKKIGHNVIFLSLTRSHINKNYNSECEEYFLPDSNNIDSIENSNFLTHIFKKNEINIVINQASVFPKVCDLSKLIRKKFNIKLITTIHYAPLFELAGIENNFFLPTHKKIKDKIVSFLLFFRYYAYHKKQLINKERKKIQDLASYSDFIVCLSEKFLPEFRHLLKNPKYVSKLVAIPNAILDIKLDSIIKKKKQVLYVGRLEFGLKRVDRIIDIWRKIESTCPDWNLCIVGDGNAKWALEQMAKKYNLKNVLFEGFKDPTKYFLESSIFCLTSSSEGFGLVLAEALSTKCVPIVYNSFLSATDIVINNVNGILVQPFRERIYINNLKKLMLNDNFREELANNNSITLQNFSIGPVLLKWEQLFSKL